MKGFSFWNVKRKGVLAPSPHTHIIIIFSFFPTLYPFLCFHVKVSPMIYPISFATPTPREKACVTVRYLSDLFYHSIETKMKRKKRNLSCHITLRLNIPNIGLLVCSDIWSALNPLAICPLPKQMANAVERYMTHMLYGL